MKQLNTLKTKRRGIFLALLLLMAMPMAAQTAGDEFNVGNLRYKVLNVDNHTVKVIPIENYLQWDELTRDEKPAYFGNLGEVVIDLRQPVTYKGKSWMVTEIGERAFQLENITEVKLPDGITRIGEKAFLKTALLTTINFPSSLRFIESGAFSGSGLAGAFKIPDNTFIGAEAFQSCVNITSLDITKVNYLGSGCFRNCSSLSNVTVPFSASIGQKLDTTLSGYKLTGSTNETSGDYAFADCYNLTEATIESRITTVPDHMFAFCGDLKTVNVPTSVTSIGDDAFRQCFSLDSIDMPAVNSIGKEAFLYCFNLKGDLVLSGNVTNLGDQAFGYTSLTGVKWEGAAGCTIGNNLFSGCHFMEYVDLHTLKNPKVANNTLNRHTVNSSDNLAGGLLSRTIVYLPQGVVFTFKKGEDVNFVKSDGTCNKLSVQDGADYEFPVRFTANTAVYNKWEVYMWDEPVTVGEGKFKNRKTYTGVNYGCDEYDDHNNIAPLITYRDFSGIKDGKNCFTMLLPYEVNVQDGFRAYKLEYRGTYNNPVGPNEYREYYLFRSIPNGSKLEANKPYLLCITDGLVHTSEAFVAKNVQVAPSGNTKVDDSGHNVTTQTSTSAIHNYTNTGTLKPQGFFDTKTGQSYKFVGCTERLNNDLAFNLHTWLLNTDDDGIDVWREVPKYIPIPEGSDMLPLKPVTAAPFRGYIQPVDNTAPAKPFVILTDDEAAAIDSLEQGTPLTGEQGIYTLDGRYAGNDLKALPSGIYVIKGKKIAK